MEQIRFVRNGRPAVVEAVFDDNWVPGTPVLGRVGDQGIVVLRYDDDPSADVEAMAPPDALRRAQSI